MPDTDISYLDTAAHFYRAAAEVPQAGLCCTTTPTWKLPDLAVPDAMVEMNYGCGSTVSLRDLEAGTNVLYVGAGAGLEVLQFAYFTRAEGSVVAIDRVPEMLEFDDGAGHVLVRDMPMAVCDKTAAVLAALGREDIVVTDATFHYDGGGCC